MKNASFCYRKIALCWFVVFFLVGIFFLFAPYQVGRFITIIAQAAGLSGNITTPAMGLWHILSLSLMSCITVLTWYSATRPEEAGPFYAIITAKLVSTLGFSVLAFQSGSVWILCALADGFVAFTLILARSKITENSFAKWKRIFSGQKPFYEVWYGKTNFNQNMAFWFRYTLRNGPNQEMAVWAAFFENENVTAAKDVLSWENAEISTSLFDADQNFLTPKRARGNAGNLKWDLRMTPGNIRYDLVPSWMTLFTSSGYLSCLPDAKISGSIHCDDREFIIDSSDGMMGHIFGKKQAQSWAWAHCHLQHEGRPVVFEALSADIRVGSFRIPRLSAFVLAWRENIYRFNSLRSLLRSSSRWDRNSWKFYAQSGGASLEGFLTLPASGVALLRYTDTDGKSLFCRNSKKSSLSLKFTDPDGHTHQFLAEHSSAFEIVERLCPDKDSAIAVG